MDISIKHEHGTAQFNIKGDIDEVGAEVLHLKFRELTSKTSLTKLVFDFKSVEYIGSSGIGTIILCYKKLAATGGKIFIVNVSDEIYDLLLDLDVNTVMTVKKA